MNRIYLILLSVFLTGCSTEKRDTEEMVLDLSLEISFPKHYIISKTSQSPVIDGINQDTVWANADFTENFIDIEGQSTPTYQTRCKMLWDDEFLYIYAELEEPHIWGNITQRDGIIYFNNDFEVFIDPQGLGEPYGEIEINALNTVWDLLMTKPYRIGGKPVFDWNLTNLKTAVHYYGSVNDPGDTDSMWTVEMAIPFKSLSDLKNIKAPIPGEGDQWRINFSRVHWEHEINDGIYERKKENGHFVPESNWVWSPQGVINMHIPEKWGYLQFTEKTDPTSVPFNVEEDLAVKQVLFALFRYFRFGPDGYTKDQFERKRLTLRVMYEKEIQTADYFPTHSGFEIMANSPLSNTTYIIDQEGRIRKKT